MKTPPIDSEEEYDRALARLEELLDAPPRSVEAEERESLLEAIEEYEEAHYPITPLGPRGSA
jgi:HTH-type transcriptional regulator / antitoxin HigA